MIALARKTLAYEWRREAGLAENLPFGSSLHAVAPRSELVGLFEHPLLYSVLVASKFHCL